MRNITGLNMTVRSGAVLSEFKLRATLVRGRRNRERRQGRKDGFDSLLQLAVSETQELGRSDEVPAYGHSSWG